MKRTWRIGLTGGIASGKTTVAQEFKHFGIPIIDADEAARAVVMPGTPGLGRVIERFGREILDASGALDRRKLRSRIFEDAAARRDLEGILHPLIRTHMEDESSHVAGPYQIFAIPLLTERAGRVDRILLVDADAATQIARVMVRDGSTREQAQAILAAQASRASRRAIADDVIDNSGSVADLRQAVEKLHVRYLQLAAAARTE